VIVDGVVTKLVVVLCAVGQEYVVVICGRAVGAAAKMTVGVAVAITVGMAVVTTPATMGDAVVVSVGPVMGTTSWCSIMLRLADFCTTALHIS
jgi:hypothetical protein